MTGTEDAHFTKTKRGRSVSRPPLKKAKRDMDEDRRRSGSVGRAPRDKSGLRNVDEEKQVKKMTKKMQKKTFARVGKSGESDRHIAVKKPKHLYSGKRGMGKTDRR